MALLLAVGILPVQLSADESQFVKNPPVDIIEFGGGYYDVNDHWKTYSAHVIYKPKYRMADIFYPIIGVMATGKGAVHGFAGVGLDYYLTNNIVISPSFAPGVYSDGAGKKLGLWLQFKSMIEVGYEFANQNRIAVGLYHISNANIGNSNQGTEVVTLTYSLPLSQK